ncbi:MAG: DUF418 domain-containing protein [Hyphomonadaceae bacterium]|nr:DUF418 domain-containing protein [Hyphomonadaceae bacterium]
MSYLQETRDAGRHVFPDLARAWALFGIALVNVAIFAWPMMKGGYAGGALETGIDQAAFFGVNALFTMKSYTLFSFMFGVGFAYQMSSAERAGTGFAGRYWRRIIGLFFFAAINITLFFQGDILFIYGVLGSLLFLFRKSSSKILIRWAVAFYIVQILLIFAFAGFMAMGQAFAPEEMAAGAAQMAEKGAEMYAVYSAGTFTETVIARTTEWANSIFFLFLIQGWGALSFFLFGLAAVRNDTIAKPNARFWETSRRIYLPIGLIIGAAGAWCMAQATSMMDPMMMLGTGLITLGSPFSTAGYLGFIVKWSLAADGPIKTFFARGGTASLTAYLMQNMLFTLVFYGFALGLYAKLGAASVIGIAAVVAVFSIAFTSLWRVRFKRGPLEYLLRGFTYWGAR